MLGLHSDYPTLPENADAKDCVKWLRALMYWGGPGFHPETSADQYVFKDEKGRTRRSFTPALCEQMNDDMTRCYQLLEPLGKDPCSIAIKPQRRMLSPRLF